MKNFDLWLRQPVTFSYGESMERRDYIPEFTKDIKDFVNSFGYRFISTWSSSIVAKWLYTLHIREALGDTSLFPYEYIQHRNTIEDEAHFHNTISDMDVDAFFDKWKDCTDLSVNTSPGNAVRDEYMRFIWNYIDLDTSHQGQVVSSILFPESESDTDDNNGNHDTDHYLRDLKDGYHG